MPSGSFVVLSLRDVLVRSIDVMHHSDDFEG